MNVLYAVLFSFLCVQSRYDAFLEDAAHRCVLECTADGVLTPCDDSITTGCARDPLGDVCPFIYRMNTSSLCEKAAYSSMEKSYGFIELDAAFEVVSRLLACRLSPSGITEHTPK